jgi:hypothetical protein
MRKNLLLEEKKIDGILGRNLRDCDWSRERHSTTWHLELTLELASLRRIFSVMRRKMRK